ncbi:MFS general substrate transporter [Echria macrotheca]|uniref:MFS general substrate transporter n=1 Tax=Echria macrotheca TaxID=438768 RepID=A0AAJ0BDP9_9PEZI|nr:MFS general substrate transporter [Echria macrotheca]
MPTSMGPADPILEKDRPAKLRDDRDARQSRPTPSSGLRLLAVCFMSFTNALSDTAPSALIPTLEKQYDTTSALLYLLFVANALGFITGAIFLEGITECLGRARTFALGQLLAVAGYLPIAFVAPFPIFMLSFFVTGFGLSLSLALGNVFCGSLRDGTPALGAMHGTYGLGACVGPLLAVSFASTEWPRYYVLMIGLTVVGGVIGPCAFWDYEEDATVPADDDAEPKHDLQGMFTDESTQIVMRGAFFMFAYRVVEVSISTSAMSKPIGSSTLLFWLGVAVARWLLSTTSRRLDERKLVYVVVVGAAASQILVWLVPGMDGNTAALTTGLLLGPVYPCAAAVFMRSIGSQEQVGGMGVISAFGSSGGAAAPFTAGLLAQLVGPVVAHPIAVTLLGVMVSCWYGLPKKPKRIE